LADSGEDVDAELDAAPRWFDVGVQDASAAVNIFLFGIRVMAAVNLHDQEDHECQKQWRLQVLEVRRVQ
jgi:hypothetical protein